MIRLFPFHLILDLFDGHDLVLRLLLLLAQEREDDQELVDQHQDTQADGRSFKRGEESRLGLLSTRLCVIVVFVVVDL